MVSHQTALSVHNMGDVNPAVIHLTVPERFAQQHDGHLGLHRRDLPHEDIQEREGFRITTPLRSLLDVAAAGAEQEVVDRAVADALDGGVVSRRQLLRRADEFGPEAALLIERALSRGAKS